jgi:glycosyltransferase involved in cell wall biosynthesis
LPGLDLYREPDPFRMPRPREYRDWVDALEVGIMMTAGYPEPLTFSIRARRLLRRVASDYDVVHDNQTLGYGLLGLSRLGLPLVTTIHHPVQIDRALELAGAQSWRRLSLRRWYGFTRMQRRVAARLPQVITVSSTSAGQIVEHLRVPAQRIDTVPIGTDTDVFAPDPTVARIPGKVVTTASADVPLKGLLPLIEAIAKVRTEQPVELVIVGSTKAGGPVAEAIDRYGVADAIRFTGRINEAELVGHLRSAELVVVPSLFEGFSLPLVEAMACGTPVVATTGGALPEVAGQAAVLVAPGDAQALAAAIAATLSDAPLRHRLGAAGRQRVVDRFTWSAAARRTAEIYHGALGR